VSVNDLVRYYRTVARAWERQVLIRSRGCAGDIGLFRSLLRLVEDLVFSKDVSVADALHNVRQSKERIDIGNTRGRGTNIKVGRGGIREIEFIAQALQLAHGGHDAWLRSPHTLVTLARLADRKYLTETDLSELSSAYEFLRRTEHVLQMENGLQTHSIPQDREKLNLLTRRMKFTGTQDLERDLKTPHRKCQPHLFTRFCRTRGPWTCAGC
jgi:glutamate-ammonia-ligase adenylyltransferase